MLNKTLSSILLIAAAMLATPAVVHAQETSAAQPHKTAASKMNKHHEPTGRYAAVNGLKLYYEIHGSGSPLLLVHGGGSTIESTFGRVLPYLAKTHQVIAVELQAHGHTKDIDRPLSFEQDADDVAALLKQLRVEKADLMGFSNGATTCIQVAIRHPNLVNKLVLASATYKRSGMPSGFFEGFKNASLKMMPRPAPRSLSED